MERVPSIFNYVIYNLIFNCKFFGADLLVNTILIGSALYLFLITVEIFKKDSELSQNLSHFGLVY